VLGLAQLLLADLPGDHPARPMVEDIERQAERIEGIVSNLLRLAQRQSGEDFRPLDLGRVVDDALELCGLPTLADPGIKVVRNVAHPGPPVRGSSLQLQAALIQLVRSSAVGASDRRSPDAKSAAHRALFTFNLVTSSLRGSTSGTVVIDIARYSGPRQIGPSAIERSSAGHVTVR